MASDVGRLISYTRNMRTVKVTYRGLCFFCGFFVGSGVSRCRLGNSSGGWCCRANRWNGPLRRVGWSCFRVYTLGSSSRVPFVRQVPPWLPQPSHCPTRAGMVDCAYVLLWEVSVGLRGEGVFCGPTGKDPPSVYPLWFKF